jgi:hypothetical protein
VLLTGSTLRDLATLPRLPRNIAGFMSMPGSILCALDRFYLALSSTSLCAHCKSHKKEHTALSLLVQCYGLFRRALLQVCGPLTLILTSRSILPYGLVGNDGAIADLSFDHDLEVSDLKRVALPTVEGEDETRFVLAC